MTRTETRPSFKTPPSARQSTIGGIMVFVLFFAILLSAPRLAYDAWFWTLLLLAPFVMAFVGGMVKHHRNYWGSIDYDYVLFDLESPEIPEEVRESIKALTPGFVALGFRVLGDYQLTRACSVSTEAYTTLLENSNTRDRASLILVFVGGVLYARSFIFHADYEDGSIYATSNVAISSPYPRPRGRDRRGSMSFPQVQSISRLYAVHRACDVPQGRAGLQPIDPRERLMSETAQLFEAWIARGYFYVDEAQRRMRSTGKGTVVSAFAFLPPGKWYRRWWTYLRAAWVLWRLGL
jgi:hypothetical protein